MTDFSASVQRSGTLTRKGASNRVIQTWVTEFAEEAGRQGVGAVKDILGSDLKNPTGYYEAHITAVQSNFGTVITDQGVIYGDWLEGVSSRNAKSRFKGYGAFRRGQAELIRRIPLIDGATRPRFIEGMER